MCSFDRVPKGHAYDGILTDIHVTCAIETKRKGGRIPIKTNRMLDPVGKLATGYIQSLNRRPVLKSRAYKGYTCTINHGPTHNLMTLHHVVKLFIDLLVLLLSVGGEDVGGVSIRALTASVLLLVQGLRVR